MIPSSIFHRAIGTTATLSTGQHFFIALEESPYDNCAWEVSFPPQLVLINTKRYFGTSNDSREWELSINTPGQYTLTFNYRKQCCTRNIQKTVSYSITIN
ncbi:MAG: protease inhibitor I42 family protein [Cellulosilyticaceae bacterium]